MDKTDKIFLGIFAFIIAFGVGGIFALSYNDAKQGSACEKAGGYYLRGRGLSECVDPRIIIKVQP